MAIHMSIVIYIFLITSFLCLGLIGIITGAAGTSWWELPSGIDRGLWKTCKDSVCEKRKEILKFSDDEETAKDLDATLLALILGAIFGLIALVPTFLMVLLCRHRPKSINTLAVLTTVFAFVAATASLGAVIFAEVQFDDLYDKNDRGWSSYMAWFGAVCMFLSFALAFCTVCGTANQKHESVSSSYDTRQGQSGMAGRSVNGQVNKGYELQ